MAAWGEIGELPEKKKGEREAERGRNRECEIESKGGGQENREEENQKKKKDRSSASIPCISAGIFCDPVRGFRLPEPFDFWEPLLFV